MATVFEVKLVNVLKLTLTYTGRVPVDDIKNAAAISEHALPNAVCTVYDDSIGAKNNNLCLDVLVECSDNGYMDFASVHNYAKRLVSVLAPNDLLMYACIRARDVSGSVYSDRIVGRWVWDEKGMNLEYAYLSLAQYQVYRSHRPGEGEYNAMAAELLKLLPRDATTFGAENVLSRDKVREAKIIRVTSSCIEALNQEGFNIAGDDSDSIKACLAALVADKIPNPK